MRSIVIVVVYLSAITTAWAQDCDQADLDGNGTINTLDHELLISCISGPGGGIPNPSCAPADLDGDVDIDLRDAALFQAIFDPPGFRGRRQVLAGDGSLGVAVQDLNGDGIPDFVTSNFLADTVSILWAEEDGTFVIHETHEVGNGPNSPIIGDFDGDEHPDWAVAVFGLGGDSWVAVALNQGDGTFAAPVNYTVNEVPVGLVMGDLDGDDDLDLVTADFESDSISILRNNGDGTFADYESVGLGAANPQDLEIADLDGDNDLDLAVSRRYVAGTDSLKILLNDGLGNMIPGQSLSLDSYPSGIAAGDLDEDQDLDLVAASPEDDVLFVFVNQGEATFEEPIVYSAGIAALAVDIADVSADGHLDVVVAAAGGDSLLIFLGNGDGTLTHHSTHEVGDSPRDVVAFDLDGDNDLDLVAANRNSDDLSLLFGLCTP